MDGNTFAGEGDMLFPLFVLTEDYFTTHSQCLSHQLVKIIPVPLKLFGLLSSYTRSPNFSIFTLCPILKWLGTLTWQFILIYRALMALILVFIYRPKEGRGMAEKGAIDILWESARGRKRSSCWLCFGLAPTQHIAPFNTTPSHPLLTTSGH